MVRSGGMLTRVMEMTEQRNYLMGGGEGGERNRLQFFQSQ